MKPYFMRTHLALIVTSIGLCMILTAPRAAAHHAFSTVYDAAKPLKLAGTVTRMDLVNPHVWIYLDVKRSDGKVEQWMVECGSAASIYAAGLTKETVKTGTEVTVDGYQSKDGALRVHGRDLTLANGRPLFIGSPGSGAPYDSLNVAQDDRRVVRTQVTGAWWTNAALLQRLGLTDDQKTKIERTFENHRLAIVSTTSALEKEEAQLERLLAAEPMDRNAVFTQVDRVIQARTETERASVAMTLEMREHLTRAQWLQLPRTNLTIRTPTTPAAPGQRRGQ